MSYRGGDLDLRTPQTRSSEERGFEATLNGRRDFDEGYFGGDARSPIYVDDTLMACCNHAFDVALAHRSADVRIEHLLYALTRIDDAAEVLEKHGVRDASLRREAGSYIASEIPIAPSNGQANPRRSQAFEQALVLAAKHAYPRNRPASVSDLLHVFTEVKPELPGLQLLHRNMGRLTGESSVRGAVYQSLPDSAFMAQQPAEPPRRHVRPVYYEDYALAEPMAYRTSPMQNHTDMVQNSRLAALEQIVMSLREETGRFTDELSGRFVSLEKSFGSPRGDDGHALKQTSARLEGIERSLIDKLEELGRQASVLAERLETMEARLQSAYSTGGVDLSPLNERLDRLEGLVRESETQSQGTADRIGERVAGEVDRRLTQIERLVGNGGSVDLVPVESRLNDIETALLSVSESRPSEEMTMARIDRLEHALSGRFSSLQQSQSADRDRVIERTNEVATSVGGISGAITTAMQRIVSAVQDMGGGVRQDFATRLEGLETMLIRQGQEAAEAREALLRERGEMHEAIKTLNANQHTLAGAIDQWRSESVNDMNTIATRLTQLDIDNERPMARLESLAERMDGMYRATVERYHRRNRFWYWLFGTDDWIGSSWPSQTAKVEQELRAVRASSTPAA